MLWAQFTSFVAVRRLLLSGPRGILAKTERAPTNIARSRDRLRLFPWPAPSVAESALARNDS